MFVDSHCHLSFPELREKLPAILSDMRAAQVEQAICICTQMEEFETVHALALEHDVLWATVGVHPDTEDMREPDVAELVRLAALPRVVAIGETGLDRHWDYSPFAMQENYFARHLELGRATGKPVVIHCREADADVLRMLRDAFDRHGPIRGVMHSFVGDAVIGRACLEMGLVLSFAGMLTYRNAAALRETAATVPLDRVMVETDCPYLSPVPLRGKRNEPANVVHTAACLAELHAIAPELLAERTTANARALFRLS